MKISKIILSCGLVALTFFGCESDEEKYEGTPVGKDNIVTLQSVISSTATQALANQEFPVTIDLQRTFSDTVNVEVTVINKGIGRTRKSIEFLPNTQVVTEKVLSPGGTLFNSTVDAYVSGIALKTAEPAGTHYLMTSNTITLNSGSTTVPADDAGKFQVKFAWLTASSASNNLRLFVNRPNALSYTSAPGATVSGSVITVNSTDGLVRGMSVAISSGTGSFPINATVSEILGTTQFKVSRPLAPLAGYQAFSNNAIVTGAGGDWYSQPGAASITYDSSTLATVTLSSGSVSGLVPGMTINVTSGAGQIKGGGIIKSVSQENNTFKIDLPNLFTNAAVALGADTVLMASYPDALPDLTPGVGRSHSISNIITTNTSGTSTPEGDYYFYLSALKLLPGVTSLPYRVIWNNPDGSDEYIDRNFDSVLVGGDVKLALKVTKTGTGENAQYVVTTY